MSLDVGIQATGWPRFEVADADAAMGLYQIIDGAGAVVDERGVAAVAVEDALAIWKTMARLRVIDTRMLALQRQGRIGFYGAATGQEAAVVAPAQVLQARDWIHPALREGGMALHRGYALQTWLAQCFGNSADNSTAGRQMPCHYGSRSHNYVTLSSVMTTQMPQAVGTSFAMALRHEAPDRPVCFVALGDGASSEGDFHVAMNFAGVMRPRNLGLPLVLFCQNNQWAISTPITSQCAAPTLASKAAGYGLVGIRVDGNDALAVARVVAEAVARARAGDPPVFIEALTYRMGAHSSSDDPSRYRDESITEKWAGRDPIVRLQKWLVVQGALDEASVDAWREHCDREVRGAIDVIEGVASPPLESLFEDVFSTPPPHLIAQRQQALQQARNGDVAG